MSHIYFEIQADDIERAMNFYKEIFCWQGYFVDPEGNTFGLFETDENAK